MTLEHLKYKHYHCDLAMGLNDDVYGANGDFDESQIKQRLIARIHEATSDEYRETGKIPVSRVAALIWWVWQYEDRRVMELEAELAAQGR